MFHNKAGYFRRPFLDWPSSSRRSDSSRLIKQESPRYLAISDGRIRSVSLGMEIFSPRKNRGRYVNDELSDLRSKRSPTKFVESREFRG